MVITASSFTLLGIFFKVARDYDEEHRVSPLCISLQWGVMCIVLGLICGVLVLYFT